MKQVVFQGPYAGILNEGTLFLENSSIYQTDFGIVNAALGNLTLTNVTISENTASALRNNGGSTFITNSTITKNRGWFVGGIQNDSGTVVLKNTVLAGNIASSPQSFTSADCQGNFVSLNNNIIGTIGSYDQYGTHDYDCRAQWGTADLYGNDDTGPIALNEILDTNISQDPNSGQWVHALKLGGLAIDTGNDTNCPAAD